MMTWGGGGDALELPLPPNKPPMMPGATFPITSPRPPRRPETLNAPDSSVDSSTARAKISWISRSKIVASSGTRLDRGARDWCVVAALTSIPPRLEIASDS